MLKNMVLRSEKLASPETERGSAGCSGAVAMMQKNCGIVHRKFLLALQLPKKRDQKERFFSVPHCGQEGR